jgi:hypothetical protein
MLKKSIYFLLTFILLFTSSGFSQLDNNTLRYDLPVNAADTQKLMFSIDNVNFLRNTEYFTKIEQGKTMFGYQLIPKLVYFPVQYLRLEAGVYTRKDFGNNGYFDIAPVFALKLQRNGFSAIFGNIEGALNHRLIEPLFNIDYVIDKPLENGFQFKVNKQRVWSDTWINWQKMIYQGSPFKEEITAGTSNVVKLVGANDAKFSISLTGQALAHHFGGQIDSDSSDIVSTYNMAGGIRLAYFFPATSFLKEVRSDNYYTYYTDESNVKKYAYSHGNGMYFNLLLRSKFVDLMFSYWKGDKYISYNGTQIYQSASNYIPGYAEKERELLFIRLLYEKQLVKDLFLNVRFEPFYSLTQKTTEFSYSIYFTYRHSFTLAKLKS